MLIVKNISYRYDEKEVLHNISFQLKKGEHLSVIGTSGSGKSTLLKAIYGLIDTHQGEISLDGKRLLGPAYNILPGHSAMKYLAQDFQLMPYISVSENVGNFISNLDMNYKKQRIEELLTMMGLLQYAHQKPLYLSGGEQQRTALAMALAKEPQVLLLDEPFSHIDSHLKNPLRRKLFNYLKEQEITTIVATHENNEALSYADSILVLEKGQQVALDTPSALYQNPPSHYVASLFGEVNALQMRQRSIIAYPHQLQVVESSDYACQVVKCYYQGNNYLCECRYQEQYIYITTQQAYSQGSILYFDTAL